MIAPRRIECVDLSVRDVKRSLGWYREHFGFEMLYEVSGGGVAIGRDGVNIALFPAVEPDHAPRGYDGKGIAIRMFALEVSEEDYRRAAAEFAEDEGLVRVDHPRYKSCITEDPDGNAIELIVPRTSTDG